MGENMGYMGNMGGFLENMGEKWEIQKIGGNWPPDQGNTRRSLVLRNVFTLI